MAKKVTKVGVKKEKGYLYFVDKQGDVSCAMMARGNKKGGKPKKVAITACMRKLLIGINNLMKTHYNNLETNTFNMLVDSSK